MIDFAVPRSRRRAGGSTLVAGSVLALSLLASPAFAAFDKPVSIKKSGGADGREIICTDYGDVAVIETRDGPSSSPAVLVTGDGARCGAAAAKRGRALATAEMALEGRLGPVLVFTEMDPHGAVGFVALRIADGAVVVKEAVVGQPAFKSTQVRRDGSVVLSYRRGVNAPCSLAQNAAACWAQMVKEGSVPPEMSAQAPQAASCAAAYKAMSAPRDAPSIAEWNQETTIEFEGRVIRRMSAPVGCGVQP